MNEFLEQEEQVLKMIKTVFDPEIPVNIYDLGLIYKIDLTEPGVCTIDMTLTAPSCPAGEFLVEDIKQKVGSVDGIETVNVNIVFEPEWSKDMMSEEAKLELGMMQKRPRYALNDRLTTERPLRCLTDRVSEGK